MTNTNSPDNVKEETLTKAQRAFLSYCKEFGWGKVEVDIKDGQPVGSWVVVKDDVVQHYTKFN